MSNVSDYENLEEEIGRLRVALQRILNECLTCRVDNTAGVISGIGDMALNALNHVVTDEFGATLPPEPSLQEYICLHGTWMGRPCDKCGDTRKPWISVEAARAADAGDGK